MKKKQLLWIAIVGVIGISIVGMVALDLIQQRLNPPFGPEAEHLPVAVTNSYLAAAVGELLGHEYRIRIIDLSRRNADGTAPHPEVLKSLEGSSILFYFKGIEQPDPQFQEKVQGLTLVGIKPPKVFSMPTKFKKVMTRIKQVLQEDDSEIIEETFPNIDENHFSPAVLRLNQLNNDCLEIIDDLKPSNVSVLTVGEQAGFCEYLTLNVVGQYQPTDSAADLRQRIAESETKPLLLIADAHNGTDAAVALGKKLKLPVVVFRRYPTSTSNGDFDQMVRANLDLLSEASRELVEKQLEEFKKERNPETED